jgi:hypothetical protein
MPIRKEFRHFYSGPEWKRTRARILKRAGNRCEICGRPNRRLVLVTLAGEWWDEAEACWRDKRGQPCDPSIKGLARRVRVILQCAHLNHSPGDDSSLAALCGRCHLNFDRGYHADVRKKRKDGDRPLLASLDTVADTEAPI